MNRLLPRDIRVLSVEEAALDFHPRFQAQRKTYEYRIFRGEICSPFERRYVCHHPYPLAVEEMIAAAPLLEGEHDFTAFAASDDRDELELSKVRTIFCSRLALEGERLIYRVTGSGFLKHMVRNIVGVLLEVGKGNVDRAGLLARLGPGCGIPPGRRRRRGGCFWWGWSIELCHRFEHSPFGIRIKLKPAFICANYNDSRAAGVKNWLWEVPGLGALLEALERGLERAA